MLPYSYNSNYQIMQTKDAVVVHAEMIHDARIIHLDRREHLSPAIRLWLGDSIGYYQGQTLVVDTTNFRSDTHNLDSAERLHVVERFTRVDASTLAIQAAIDGHGVALGRSVLVADDLATGRLVKPLEVIFRLRFGYYIVHPRKVSAARAVEAFKTWLRSEVAPSPPPPSGPTRRAPSARTAR